MFESIVFALALLFTWLLIKSFINEMILVALEADEKLSLGTFYYFFITILTCLSWGLLYYLNKFI